MRPRAAVLAPLFVLCLQADGGVLAFVHSPKSAGPGEHPSSRNAAPAAAAAAPGVIAKPEQAAAKTAAARPQKVWVDGHWVLMSPSIPKKIWVTGQWSSDSEEVNAEISKNIGDPIEQKRADILRGQVETYFARWVPVGSYVRYFSDEDMDSDVRDISKMLVPMGIKDLDRFYHNIRPGAFRADVWRLLKLWAEGGVYLDANINLTRNITDWIDFSKDEVVLVRDRGIASGYWNAMMASPPKSDYLERAIHVVASNLRRHYYGSNPLAITGPIALDKAVKSTRGFPKGLRRNLEWTNGKVQDDTGAVMARKDGALHDHDPSRHYDPMWRHHQVYCDEKGPTPDNGMCEHS